MDLGVQRIKSECAIFGDLWYISICFQVRAVTVDQSMEFGKLKGPQS